MIFRHSLKLKYYVPLLFCFGFSYVVTAQEIEVSGTVIDNDSVPIPGVNVTIEGESQGTSTDFDGNYTIDATEGDVLRFASIGFEDQLHDISQSDVIDVVMQEDVGQLEEVVVTGYGKQTRNRLTTSISKMDDEVLQTSTRSNAATALQGEVPGLQISNNTGQPGTTPTLKLRGGTDFDGSGNPLVLIDGMPGDWYGLNSDDIESIEVLKDAAATAIYGARAADGVILITTKGGEKGKSSISVKQKFSFNHKRKNQSYVGAEDFITYNRLAVEDYRKIMNDPNGFGNFLDGNTAFGTGNNTTNDPYST